MKASVLISTLFSLLVQFFIFHYFELAVGLEDSLALYDDNFCDFSDGRDELHSSACSHVTPAVQFTCADFTSRAYTIPTSRVNDGVCDCCDGSDEYGAEPWIPLCPITCGFPVAESLKSNMKMTEKLSERRKYPVLVVSTTASSVTWTRIAGVVHLHNTRYESNGIDFVASIGNSQNNISYHSLYHYPFGGYLRQRSNAENIPIVVSLNGTYSLPSISSLNEAAATHMKHALSSLNSLNIAGSSGLVFNDWSNNTSNGEWVALQLANHTSKLATVTHTHMKAAHEAASAWIAWAQTDVYAAVTFSCMVIGIAICCFFFGQCVLRPCFRRQQRLNLMSMYSSRANVVLGRGSSKFNLGGSDDATASTCDLTRKVRRECTQICMPFLYAYSSCCKCCSSGNCCRSCWCICCTRWKKRIEASATGREAFSMLTKNSTDSGDGINSDEGRGMPIRIATAVSRDNLAVLTHRQSAATSAAGFHAV